MVSSFFGGITPASSSLCVRSAICQLIKHNCSSTDTHKSKAVGIGGPGGIRFAPNIRSPPYSLGRKIDVTLVGIVSMILARSASGENCTLIWVDALFLATVTSAGTNTVFNVTLSSP